MQRTRERSPPSPSLDHVCRAKLGVIQTRIGSVGTSRVRDCLARRIDQNGTGCKSLLVAPESDWKLNHLAGPNRTRPSVNHLVQYGQVTIGVTDPTIGCARRSRSFGHCSANYGWRHSEETCETSHCVTRTRLVTHAVGLTIPMKIAAVGCHKVHHLVIPGGTWVRWLAAVRQPLIILENTLRDSVACLERQPPCFVPSHVPRNVLVD